MVRFRACPIRWVAIAQSIVVFPASHDLVRLRCGAVVRRDFDFNQRLWASSILTDLACKMHLVTSHVGGEISRGNFNGRTRVGGRRVNGHHVVLLASINCMQIRNSARFRQSQPPAHPLMARNL